MSTRPDPDDVLDTLAALVSEDGSDQPPAHRAMARAVAVLRAAGWHPCIVCGRWTDGTVSTACSPCRDEVR